MLMHTFLPSVISHLSVGEHSVDEEAFQSTMKYIFTFIEKVTTVLHTFHIFISLTLCPTYRKSKPRA